MMHAAPLLKHVLHSLIRDDNHLIYFSPQSVSAAADVGTNHAEKRQMCVCFGPTLSRCVCLTEGCIHD